MNYIKGCMIVKRSKGDHSKHSMTSRKVLRKLFGSVNNIDIESYERRHNINLINIYGKSNILLFSRSK